MHQDVQAGHADGQGPRGGSPGSQAEPRQGVLQGPPRAVRRPPHQDGAPPGPDLDDHPPGPQPDHRRVRRRAQGLAGRQVVQAQAADHGRRGGRDDHHARTR